MSGCTLCPRACGVDRQKGLVGACGAADELLVSHVMLHQWEEPPISGSVGSGAVFFPGCSLGCAYCQNHAISRACTGRHVSTAELADIFLGLEAQGALNVNLVTPTHFAPQIREALRLARKAGLQLPVVWNTSGYETVDALAANAGYVDVYLTDFKYASSVLSSKLSRAADYPEVALAAIHEMVRQVGGLEFDAIGGCERVIRGVIVRHLVLPGLVAASCGALDVLRHEFGDAVHLSIMSQYTPQMPADSPLLDEFPDLARRVTDEEYEAVLDHADALGYADYFWQQGDPAQESFIPDFRFACEVMSS